LWRFKGNILALFIIIISEILEIPLAIYSTFVIEEKYGFNKTTKKTFVTDIIKNLIISSVISCSIYAVVIGIIENLGSNWWIFAFGAVFSIQLIIFFLYPVLIMPLFNKFEPLDDEQFKKPIEKLLEKVKFKAKGLFVMNASLRSSHGNAFFTGFGNNKRIVFYDTLLETITPDEMEAILGHELGHYKLGHIRKSLISSLVFGFIGFYILSEIFKSENFFITHGLDEITLYSKFILFYLVAGTYTFFTRPITSYLSRQREFAADDFSFKFTDGNLKKAEEILKRYPEKNKKSAVMPFLYLAQKQNSNWIPLAAMKYIAKFLSMPYISVYEVATFYSMYNLAPVGKHFIQVCTTTPCLIRGADKIVKLCKEKISPNENELSQKGNCSWMEVECLGACVNAPMIQINDDYYEDLDEKSTIEILNSLIKDKPLKPGSYRGRNNTAPEKKPTINGENHA